MELHATKDSCQYAIWSNIWGGGGGWRERERETKLKKNVRSKQITGLSVEGDKICNKGEIESSTRDLIAKCLEIYGGILFCQDLNISTLSINDIRYLKVYDKKSESAMYDSKFSMSQRLESEI